MFSVWPKAFCNIRVFYLNLNKLYFKKLCALSVIVYLCPQALQPSTRLYCSHESLFPQSHTKHYWPYYTLFYIYIYIYIYICFQPIYTTLNPLGWVEVRLYSFLGPSALDGVGVQPHAPATSNTGKTLYPMYRRLGGPQGRSGRAKNLVLTGIRSRTAQPFASRYTDWATRFGLYICPLNPLLHKKVLNIRQSVKTARHIKKVNDTDTCITFI